MKKIPRWITSWPEWFGIHGNVEVVPASDYDALKSSRAETADPAGLSQPTTETDADRIRQVFPNGVKTRGRGDEPAGAASLSGPPRQSHPSGPIYRVGESTGAAAEPTEEEVERAAKIIADSPLIDAPKLGWPQRPEERWLIWSHEHQGYWPSDRRGYVSLQMAGRFTFNEALEIVRQGNQGMATIPEETMLPAESVLSARDNALVEGGPKT